MYDNKILKMNGDKTFFITIASSHDEKVNRKIKIKIDQNVTLVEDDVIKILGFLQNRRNSMDSQVNAIS